MQQPAWLGPAWLELGERERAGNAHNARILALYRDAGHAEIKADEVAWCAAFAGACLERAGVASTRSLRARSYLTWGQPLDEGRLGAIAVFSRGADTSLGHVGFWIGATQDSIIVLGGNQGDAVSVARIAKSRLLGLRWPVESASSEVADDGAKDDAFSRAFAHVLEMEGGFTEDPYDPGGPTNFGIILKEFAAWKDERLDAASTARLKAELKAIDRETVRDIYFKNYWTAAGCAELPAALAFMHFDAAVNQGVGTAVRFLQQAVGADVDGEIGPLTRAAIRRAPIAQTLTTYAELRRRRYRSLQHFWRFGRGWLRRVDMTLNRARALLATPDSSQPQQGDPDMTETSSTETSNETAGKWWGHSLTIWGTIVSALAVVVPAVGPALGVDVSADLVQNAGDEVVTAVQAVGALIGTLMTIYGRLRASQPITRRRVSLKI